MDEAAVLNASSQRETVTVPSTAAQREVGVLEEQAADVRRLRVKLLNAMDSLGHLKKMNPAP